MKWLKTMALAMSFLSTVSYSYPQAMLKNQCEYCTAKYVNIVDKVYKSENKYLQVDVIIPQVIDRKCNEKVVVINDKIIKWTEDWINDAKLIADDYYKGKTPPLVKFELLSRYKINRSDNVVSLYIDYYQFTGGAHGVTTRIAYNIDCNSGNELKIKDLFKEGYDYKTAIDNEINKQINENPDKYFKGKDGFNGIGENEKFYIKNDEIVIYYGEYEIAPYAAGLPEFHIPIKEFNNNYLYEKVDNI